MVKTLASCARANQNERAEEWLKNIINNGTVPTLLSYTHAAFGEKRKLADRVQGSGEDLVRNQSRAVSKEHLKEKADMVKESMRMDSVEYAANKNQNQSRAKEFKKLKNTASIAWDKFMRECTVGTGMKEWLSITVMFGLSFFWFGVDANANIDAMLCFVCWLFLPSVAPFVKVSSRAAKHSRPILSRYDWGDLTSAHLKLRRFCKC